LRGALSIAWAFKQAQDGDGNFGNSDSPDNLATLGHVEKPPGLGQ
jgi:hypothetical protein